MSRIAFIGFILIVLTGWDMEEGLQEAGEDIRTGVKNAEQAFKEAPAAISEAGNKIEAAIRKKINEPEDSESKEQDKRGLEKQQPEKQD